MKDSISFYEIKSGSFLFIIKLGFLLLVQNVNCVKTTLLSLAKCNLLLLPLQKKLDATKSKIVFNLTSFSISVMLVFAIVKVNWEQNAEPFTLKVGNLTLKWVVPLHSVKIIEIYAHSCFSQKFRENSSHFVLQY